jgi:hypothetical protein
MFASGGQDKTKNHLFINALASLDKALDCVAPNNRLKRRSEKFEPGPIQVSAPELALNISIETIFPTRTDGRFACGKCSARLRAKLAGNWESDERDIRH